MTALLGLSRLIDNINIRLGRFVAWAIVIAVMVSAINAIIRKVLDTSSNSWLELQWILFGAVFLLCAPWTLSSNEHIRIDVVSSHLSKTTRNWIDIIGHVFFLMPITIVMVWLAWPFFTASLPTAAQFTDALGRLFGSLLTFNPYRIVDAFYALLSTGEQSPSAGGLPQWLPKALIPLGFGFLFAQGVSELIKRIAIMTGDLEDTLSGGGHHAAAEAEAQRLKEALEEEARKREADLLANKTA